MTVDNLPLIELPIIDFGPYLDPSSTAEQRQAVDHAIDKACRHLGIFYLVNHGIPQELCDKMSVIARQFFSLPFEEKRKHKVGGEVRGYWFTTNAEDLSNIPCEGIAFHPPVNQCSNGVAPDIDPASPEARLPTTHDALGGQHSWPNDHFRAHAEELLSHIVPLKVRLLDSISNCLGLSDASRKLVQNTVPHIAFNSYSSLTKAQMEEGVSNLVEHTDPGTITILTQDVDVVALQVKDSDGKWCGVKPIPGSFVVNVGSSLNRFTGNQYVDTLHRVIHCSEKSRISMALLADPVFDVVIEPLPECPFKTDLAKFVPKTFGAFYLDQVPEDH
ncbi:hypothetical protein THASP1DRAFT_32060 [Thamnocephalis sphaerospora]|uniref:Fe2OG dioxygenase domain-containing protein n=1 Tax=Thamnocephalis sphaerospora TaxID=78915 RepID=A0A4V1IW29_9FUNG|nr:hypothetical protein THASP1DRAFT_32060 [Thamnocephalis sphaerospora]|eukprot:RKP06119.1 hypothetical protein THASP1DRAFT_32060 [Thamnocephalis sphaerospora]